MKLKIEDIVFWVLILATIVVLLWLLKGSPTLENAVITIGLFIISSELMLWKKYFEIGKNTAVSFMRLKNDISNISKKLDVIEKLIKNKK